LEFEQPELKAWLKAQGQAWREDRSNHDTRLRRNLLRQKALPLLEQAWPGAVAHMAAAAGRLREHADLLAAQAESVLRRARKGPRGLNLAVFAAWPPLLRRQALRQAAQACPGLEKGLDAAATTRLEQLADKGHGQADLLAGWRATVARGVLRFSLIPPGRAKLGSRRMR
jgi:tRNA(Ile)-lysidine synthase